MFQSITYNGTKEQNYSLVLKQLKALIDGEPNVIANLSNASALLNEFLDDVNWVGFYMMEDGELVLGPFQGLPACLRITPGKGVCGTAVSEQKTQRVEDVNAFPGHIACDAASQSEIVVPIMKDDEVFGVLDIDSPSTDRFDETDEKYLNEFVSILEQYI
ncbi:MULTISPECIES: GAF domain-containing protein [Salimicrobium]|uniref:Free methionine-(R)-sulfoxide reductase fRMsr n=3 Tax=Salimicrobium TaxID=351195 RepID=K2G6Z0_9BACI|nr:MULTISPECIES: GAF domain-containing protein [Salimicrobium]AKG04120.1 histidine kinase [Salimicrobium jeotgali]EKE30963.1 Free methionine-(R)-sulfoxide reductase fRMsr [Salimicrobium jeotgali]MBM7697428.1 GAF domain-containing protein [Salimicrobium jeotgali]SDX58578.1 GAF domain-containing protein [Salimicrobium album]SIS49275.1 GAF domain-containing protein [Salimicrobium salexigens]